MSRIDIYQKRAPAEDTTPISAGNPRTNTAGQPSISTAGKATIAYGAIVARQAYQTATGEMRARGNIEMANRIENAATGLMYGTLIIGTGGKAAIPIAISGISQGISQVLERNRENEEIQLMNRLRGRQVGGVFD